MFKLTSVSVSVSTAVSTVSTIVSTVSKTVSVSVSVTVSVSTAVVSTVVCGGSFGISLCFGFSISRSFVDLRDTVGGSRGRNVLVAWGSGYETVTVVSTESIGIGTIGTETIRISTISVAVECDSSFGICFRFGIGRSLAEVVSSVSVGATVSVSSVAVVSTIVSAVSKTVSVTVSVTVSTAVVSTVVGGSGFGISLGFGLGGHDGEKSNCENGLKYKK
jgi:hypothetical protein